MKFLRVPEIQTRNARPFIYVNVAAIHSLRAVRYTFNAYNYPEFLKGPPSEWDPTEWDPTKLSAGYKWGTLLLLRRLTEDSKKAHILTDCPIERIEEALSSARCLICP